MPVQATICMPVSSATLRMKCTSRPPNIAVGSQIVLTPCSRAALTASTAAWSSCVASYALGPLLGDRLVAEAHVLVHEHRAEAVGVDRAGNRLDGRHQASACSLRPSAAPPSRKSLTCPSTGPRISMPSIRPGSTSSA